MWACGVLRTTPLNEKVAAGSRVVGHDEPFGPRTETGARSLLRSCCFALCSLTERAEIQSAWIFI